MRQHRSRRVDEDKIALLRSLPLFGACTREELERLASLFDEADRPAGTVLVREGEPGNEFFVIVDGTAAASLEGRAIATLGRGDFFGEMSLLEVAPRVATVVAETDLSLLVLEPRGFASLVAAAPSVGVRMLRALSGRLRSAESPAGAVR